MCSFKKDSFYKPQWGAQRLPNGEIVKGRSFGDDEINAPIHSAEYEAWKN